MTGRAKTSSSIHYQWTFDVFFNFRGEDTRYGFIGNLHEALNQKGVHTFFDDKEIGIGDGITPKLLKAIKESRMAITVFSKNYASSTFCLNELVQIHQCIMGNNRPVWPIFYDVEPSEVRHQRGKYGEALVTHEQNSRVGEDKMNRWKHALREVATLKGLTYDPRKDYESELLDKIVNHIFRIIERDPLDVAEYPVGLNSRVEIINSLLKLGSNDEVIMIGICGTGGMGKTTITRAVYNAIADGFDYLCFIDDIKGESRKHGLQHVQARMLYKILGKKIEIEDIYQGVQLIKRILKDKKILLILDNIDERKQLEKLAGACEWFGLGSRIIITTRDKHLLRSHGVEIERIYEMEGLNAEESLELLRWKAFRKTQDDDGLPLEYTKVVNQVISYAGGLPLAIELIGSDLYDKSVREWESMLDGCKGTPHNMIQHILQVSYDGLQERQQDAFLDIACFYKGSKLEYVKKMVARAHDFDPDYHIGVLIDKCLIKIESYHCIEMHDLVQDMGREIVRQESPKDPRKRSRLWSSEDILRVLKRSEGTNEVIIIIQVEKSKCIKDWDEEAFKNMNSLKILILENTKFSRGPKYLPESLRVLRWKGYPSSSLPSGFCLEDLVEFDVGDSQFNSVEIISQIMLNVSVLKFRGCEYITKIPNLSSLSSLKELRLAFCENLIEIDNSVGQLAKLETLDVYCCSKLTTFPREMNTPSLHYLNLEFCSNLNYFPEIVARDMKISELSLYRTGIDQLPASIENLTQLSTISIQPDEDRIRSMKLPSSTFLLPQLRSIYVGGYQELLMEGESIICPNIRDLDLRRCHISNENLGIYLTSFSNVHYLNLAANDFTILPACIGDCQNLVKIVLDECKHLVQVEKVPPNIKWLTAGNCTSLSSESRKLLLSKELLAYVVPINNERLSDFIEGYFCVPGGSIPKWFDHCSKGSSISFWVRDHYFPILCVCAILEPRRVHFGIRTIVLKNDEMAYMNTFQCVRTGYEEDHIIVRYLWDFKIDRLFEKDQWTHAEICISSDFEADAVKEIGIYEIKYERTNMKFF